MRPKFRVHILLTALLSALALLIGVGPSTAAPPEGKGTPATAQRHVSVATYNVYLGADLNPLFGATSFEDLVQRAGLVYKAMESTDFTERSVAIAKLLAKERPDVVGLQEVALWETAPLGTQNFTPTYDFLQLLLDALAAEGVPYKPVATNVNFTGQLPISMTEQARFTDHDVILIRDGIADWKLSATNPREFTFAQELVIPTPLGIDFSVPRGWSTVDVTVRGQTFRFANTHLEAFSEQVRNIQAMELAADLAASPYPVVMVGDINSRPPYDINHVAYDILTGIGLDDAWPVAHPKDVEGGFTSGQSDTLLNQESLLTHRIDVVFYSSGGFKAYQAEVIGEEQRDRSVPSGFWPSDHAGVVAKLKLAKPER